MVINRMDRMELSSASMCGATTTRWADVLTVSSPAVSDQATDTKDLEKELLELHRRQQQEQDERQKKFAKQHTRRRSLLELGSAVSTVMAVSSAITKQDNRRISASFFASNTDKSPSANRDPNSDPNTAVLSANNDNTSTSGMPTRNELNASCETGMRAETPSPSPGASGATNSWISSRNDMHDAKDNIAAPAEPAAARQYHWNQVQFSSLAV
jgi:hypothetical protein